MTPEFAEDALKADLEQLLAGQLFPCSAGQDRPIQIYIQDLPVTTGNDDTDRSQDVPEPYIIVRTNEGTIPAGEGGQEVQLILVICLYNPSPDRQGHRDVLHIIHEITASYCKNPVIRLKAGSAGARGGPWTVKKPIQWATQAEETHPYYYGAVECKLEMPAVQSEVPFL